MRKKVKRKKKHHLNRLKTRKAGSSWFKLVYFDIFLLIYFRFSTIIITFATKYQFKHTSNNLKRYITSNPQPIGFRGNLLVKRQKFFYCTYSLGITETS